KHNKRKTPDDGLINEEVKKVKHYHSTLQVVVSSSNLQHNDEKKADEITFKNTWKKNMKTRRQFLCSNVSTIVITPLFVHFAVDISEQQLIQFANSFNDATNEQIEQKENQDGKQRTVRQPRCDIYRKTFAEQKRRREEAVTNPDVNRFILLRGVSIHENDNDIKETLEDYGY
ncbi:hypothetical protein RFI_38315, partial [Reticulomyxa filosa]